jgi:hypothetical protein
LTIETVGPRQPNSGKIMSDSVSQSLSDVEVIPTELDEENLNAYTPIEARRGIDTFWLVENKVMCAKYIATRLKV